ncbi:MAG: RagB/SusD family nutrient uptake outer membrane protein [Bacteroidales bacterium]|nr:RagB/SusD family nutrient uptake outer membrane protein [Bacteroidales bacterium]
MSNPNSLITTSFYQTEEDAVHAANAAYSAIQREGFHGYYFAFTQTIRSDEAQLTSKTVGASELIPINSFTATGDNETVAVHWRDMWNGVWKSNLAIYAIPNIEFEDQLLKDRLLGEAKFLRAFYYFHLVLLFGDEIPLILEPPANSDDFFPSNANEGEIYNQIIEDFQEAERLLLNKQELDTKDLGRATKGAAAAYLGKVYLFQKEWEEAATVLKRIIDKEYGNYSLCSNYRDNHTSFNENNIESIFEIQFSLGYGNVWGYGTDISWGGESHNRERGMTSILHWWNAMPTQKTIDEFEEGDLRKYYSCYVPNGALYKNEAGIWKTYEELYDSGQYGWRKYSDDVFGETTDSDINIRVMRYADVLLMYAEALIVLNTGDPAQYINMVRARSNLPTDEFPEGGSIPTVQELIAQAPVINGIRIFDLTTAIRHERFVELAGESHRWDDLVRWGIASEIITAPGFRVGVSEILPFYQGDLDTNPNLNPNIAN